MADDGFSSEIRARCMSHWPDLVKAAARRWSMKDSEYIRSALAERLERDGFTVAPVHPDPEQERMGAAARAALSGAA